MHYLKLFVEVKYTLKLKGKYLTLAVHMKAMNKLLISLFRCLHC